MIRHRLRQHAPYALLFLVGAAFALVTLTAIRTAGADSIAPHGTVYAEPPPEIAMSARPSDAISTVEGVRREAQTHGWALGALVGLILASRALRRARRRWPDSQALQWMAGRAGIVVIGAGVVGSAAFDALILGGSWLAAGYAAVGASLALLDPHMSGVTVDDWTPATPPLVPPRARTERGFASGSAIIWLAILGILISGAALASCAGVGKSGRAATDAVIDCTTGIARDRIVLYGDRFEAALLDGTAPNGEVNFARAEAELAAIGKDVGACALAAAVTRFIYPSADAVRPRGLLAAPQPAAASLRRGFDDVRARVYGGARFKIELGPQ